MPVYCSHHPIDLCPGDIPCGEVRPSASAFVPMLHAQGLIGGGRQSGMYSASGLNAGLLISGEDVVAVCQGLFFPAALIALEDAICLLLEGWIAWKHPRVVSPWSNGVLAEPAPTVALPIDTTMPRQTASRRTSRILSRDNVRSCSWGSSQASALTATTTLGGKLGETPASRSFVKAGKASLIKAFAPLADDLARWIKPRGDFVVAESTGCVEDDWLGQRLYTVTYIDVQ